MHHDLSMQPSKLTAAGMYITETGSRKWAYQYDKPSVPGILVPHAPVPLTPDATQQAKITSVQYLAVPKI